MGRITEGLIGVLRQELVGPKTKCRGGISVRCGSCGKRGRWGWALECFGSDDNLRFELVTRLTGLAAQTMSGTSLDGCFGAKALRVWPLKGWFYGAFSVFRSYSTVHQRLERKRSRVRSGGLCGSRSAQERASRQHADAYPCALDPRTRRLGTSFPR